MAALERLRIQWTSFQGSPGVSTLYFTDAAGAQNMLQTFLETVSTGMPSGVGMTVAASGDVIESTTGQITGTWIGAAKVPVVGIVAGPYSAPTGLTVRWDTDVFLSGRRLRGRTYFVPMAAQAFDAGGQVNPTFLADVRTAAQTFVTAAAGNFKVYQRPREATPLWTDVRGVVHQAVAARAGGFGPVNVAFVPEKAAVLTSRRD